MYRQHHDAIVRMLGLEKGDPVPRNIRKVLERAEAYHKKVSPQGSEFRWAELAVLLTVAESDAGMTGAEMLRTDDNTLSYWKCQEVDSLVELEDGRKGSYKGVSDAGAKLEIDVDGSVITISPKAVKIGKSTTSVEPKKRGRKKSQEVKVEA